MEANKNLFYQPNGFWFLEGENVPIRVLIPFLSLFSKVFFWFTFLVNANGMFMMLMTCLST